MINIKTKPFKKIKFIDLFAGIGGFRLALESFGAKCVFSSEWDKYAANVYYDNFSEMPEGDITKISTSKIPDHNILCAGFPCQPFSISGKQKGFNDSRGTMFFEIARIVKDKKPELLFLENVKNIVKHNNGKTFQRILSILNDLGYTTYWSILNALNFGVPQNRERVYLVCFRKNLKVKNFHFPKKMQLNKCVSDVLENKVNPKLFYKGVVNIVKKTTRKQPRPIQLGVVHNGGQGNRIYSPLGTSITLSAMGGGTFSKTGGYLINGKVRKLIPRECARLMGFPENYKICKIEAQAYKQFGNSVVVDVLQYIIKNFVDYLV